MRVHLSRRPERLLLKAWSEALASSSSVSVRMRREREREAVGQRVVSRSVRWDGDMSIRAFCRMCLDCYLHVYSSAFSAGCMDGVTVSSSVADAVRAPVSNLVGPAGRGGG